MSDLLKQSLLAGMAEAVDWNPELPFPTNLLDWVQWHHAPTGKMLYLEIALVDAIHGKNIRDLNSEADLQEWVETRDGIGAKILKCLDTMGDSLAPRTVRAGCFANYPEKPFRCGIFGHGRLYVFLPRLELEGEKP